MSAILLVTCLPGEYRAAKFATHISVRASRWFLPTIRLELQARETQINVAFYAISLNSLSGSQIHRNIVRELREAQNGSVLVGELRHRSPTIRLSRKQSSTSRLRRSTTAGVIYAARRARHQRMIWVGEREGWGKTVESRRASYDHTVRNGTRRSALTTFSPQERAGLGLALTGLRRTPRSIVRWLSLAAKYWQHGIRR